MVKYETKISTILDEQLKSKGITLKKLSESTGIKYARLVSWRHKNNPRVGPELMICALYFEISLSYLLFGQEEDGFLKAMQDKLQINEPVEFEIFKRISQELYE